MNDLPDSEKQKLALEAFKSFFDQFQPLDVHSIILLEEVFKILMGRKNENISVPPR